MCIRDSYYATEEKFKGPYPRDEVKKVENAKSRPDADLETVPLLTKWKIYGIVKGKGKESAIYTPHWELQFFKQKTDRFNVYNMTQSSLERKKRTKAEDELLAEYKICKGAIFALESTLEELYRVHGKQVVSVGMIEASKQQRALETRLQLSLIHI